jgi:hypothetical protein
MCQPTLIELKSSIGFSAAGLETTLRPAHERLRLAAKRCGKSPYRDRRGLQSLPAPAIGGR